MVVSLITERGSVVVEDPALADFPSRTFARTSGPDDEWTLNDDGRTYLNGIPTNLHSGQRIDTSRATEVFQTPPRQLPVEEEDDGVIHPNRILPLDSDEDSMDLLPCGKPRPPHDF